MDTRERYEEEAQTNRGSLQVELDRFQLDYAGEWAAKWAEIGGAS